MPHIILRLEGPMSAYGAERVDHLGPVTDTPGRSAITGLLANALGIDRQEGGRLQALQDRLRMACRIDHDEDASHPMTDYQTALIGAADQAWTWSGRPFRRTGSPQTYDAPYVTPRAYTTDTLIHVAVGLEPPGADPDLADLRDALLFPARPLFLGRKACLPTAYLFHAESPHSLSPLQALLDLPREPRTARRVRFQWDPGNEDGCDGRLFPERTLEVSDERDHLSGPHKGFRRVAQGSLAASRLPEPAP